MAEETVSKFKYLDEDSDSSTRLTAQKEIAYQLKRIADLMEADRKGKGKNLPSMEESQF